MTIFLLLKEIINMPIDKMGLGSNLACFVVVNKGGDLIKIFNIIPSVPLKTVPFLTDQILNIMAFIFFDLTLVQELFYLKVF